MTRVLIFSKRNLEVRKWHAFQYEFEDVIAEVDDVDLLAPPPVPRSWDAHLPGRIARRLPRPERRMELPIAPVTLDGRYDLFFAIFHFAPDIEYLRQLRQCRARSTKAVCYIAEIYRPDELRPYLELLRELEFDHVFLFNARAAEGVSRIAGCPSEFLPVAVDALRFSPHPDPPPRSVDLYSFGRRSPVTHEAALEMAQNDGAFYLYDTVFDAPLLDHRTHRQLIAETMKRSRYFFAYKASEDRARAAEDDDLSARYFEGTAGGAVLLGSSPDTREYRQCFDWPDATIDIPYDASDLRSIVEELDAQPERLAQARLNNVVGTLRRHDWVHRWEHMLNAVGMPPTPAMAQRRERLEQLADAAAPSVA
jgi:hypothetical protein